MLRSVCMLTLCLAAGAVCAQADDPLLRVRIAHAQPDALLPLLGDLGLDLEHAVVRKDAVEVIVSTAELAILRDAGLSTTELDRGRPLREILAEQALLDGVPPGYLDLGEIVDQMQATAAAFPAVSAVVDLTAAYGVPATFEGRHAFAMKISDHVGTDEDEPAALFVSNHHAREIVTPVIALHLIEQLTAGYGVDPDITRLVDEYEIWIAPVWNPDGYNWVFEGDNFWRKNRRVFPQGTGVDLNRNYPFGWDSPCGGSTSHGSETYRGPAPASEAETQTMIALADDRHFAKVFDYHSYAREVRYGFGCLNHPFTGFWVTEAEAIAANVPGYTTRSSCCTGGDIHFHIANKGTHAFLWETHTEFQPSHASAVAEAALVFPAALAYLDRPISIHGHVVDPWTGDPVVADVELLNVTFQNGERNTSEPRFGRYHMTVPPGDYSLRFSAPGHAAVTTEATVTPVSSEQIEIALADDDTARPASVAVLFGVAQAGTIDDLLLSDDQYFVVEQRPAFTVTLPVIRVQLTATAPTRDIVRLTARLEAAATAIPSRPPQRLRLFDHDANAWVLIDDRPATLGDSVVEVDLDASPQRFIRAGDLALASRVDWFDPGNVFFPAWGARIDQAVWRVVPAD